MRSPGVPRWEATAVAWLLDHCPPEYRGHAVLRHHPVVLAWFAGLHVEAQQTGCERGLSTARGHWRDADPDVVEAAVQVLLAEAARLVRLRREVRLVGEALGGRRFRARL